MQNSQLNMSSSISSEDPEQNVANLGDLMRESHENIIKGLRDRQLQLGMILNLSNLFKLTKFLSNQSAFSIICFDFVSTNQNARH